MSIRLFGLLFDVMAITTYGYGISYPWWLWVFAIIDILNAYNWLSKQIVALNHR